MTYIIFLAILTCFVFHLQDMKIKKLEEDIKFLKEEHITTISVYGTHENKIKELEEVLSND